MRLPDLFCLTPWRSRLLAVLLGLCGVLALPPFYAIPLLIPAFSGLFLLTIAVPTARKAFGCGWWWGIGYFTPGLYWICISLYVEPEKFAWLTPFALFGLPAALSLHTGLVTLGLFWAGRYIPADRPIARIILFASLWCGLEWLRGHWFSGFPWNLIGYAWTVSNVSIQTGAVAGIYGLGWLTVLCAAMASLYVLNAPGRKAACGLAIAVLAVAAGFGAWRLAEHPTRYSSIKIRVVQANIAQRFKWDPALALAGLKRHVELTRLPGLDDVNAVIWPETAIPYIVQPESQLLRDLGGILPQHALLIAGGMRGQGSEPDWHAWNTMFVINHAGEIAAQYDKHHLVPFGEYIPLRGVLPVENIAGGMGDFDRGPGPQTLQIGNLPSFSPLICYEAIFPGEATDGTERARWLINITNDAWFGSSSGPYQHLQMARMRAVEEGVPLIRAANTGISAAFDGLGRELNHLPIEKAGIFDLYLPYSKSSLSTGGRINVAFILLVIGLIAGFLQIEAKTGVLPR
jgi:apolipoprotein N-acyltransferase